MNLACLFLLLLLPLLPLAAAQTPQANLLVSVSWLAQHHKDPNLILLHIGDRGEFNKEHLPGAQFISMEDISAPRDMSGNALILELPSPAKFQEAMETRGISNDSRVVVYFGKDTVSPATRIVWTLTYFGMGDRTSLLDGGMPAWRAAGRPLTAEVAAPKRGRFTPQLHPEIFADAKWIAEHLHQPGVSLIDARRPDDYAGMQTSRTMSRRGHIPGASNLPIEKMVDDDARLKDPAALTEMLRDAAVKPGSEVVSYCYIGQRATLTWFVARLLGYDARMYDGSWDEWSKRADLPVAVSVETSITAPQ